MLRGADYALADKPIVRIGPVGRQSTEPFCQCQSDAMPIAGSVEEPQPPERAQPILGIVKALRNLEGLCPGRAGLGATSDIYQRSTQSGLEFHLVARVPARSGPESGEGPLDAAATLLKQRQVHP